MLKAKKPAGNPESESEIQPEGELEAGASQAESEAELEAEAEEIYDEIPDINARPIPMRHPDGDGACDLYEQDKDGNILVPANEAHLMAEHGFVVAIDSDA